MRNLANARTIRRALRLYDEGKKQRGELSDQPRVSTRFSSGLRADHRGSENGGTRRKKGKRAHRGA